MLTLLVAATGIPPFETTVAVARRNGERVVDFAITFIFYAKYVRDNERNDTSERQQEILRYCAAAGRCDRCEVADEHDRDHLTMNAVVFKLNHFILFLFFHLQKGIAKDLHNAGSIIQVVAVVESLVEN